MANKCPQPHRRTGSGPRPETGTARTGQPVGFRGAASSCEEEARPEGFLCASTPSALGRPYRRGRQHMRGTSDTGRCVPYIFSVIIDYREPAARQAVWIRSGAPPPSEPAMTPGPIPCPYRRHTVPIPYRRPDTPSGGRRHGRPRPGRPIFRQTNARPFARGRAHRPVTAGSLPDQAPPRRSPSGSPASRAASQASHDPLAMRCSPALCSPAAEAERSVSRAESLLQ